MNYFKSNYDEVGAYSKGWYGTRDYAPPATILLYNDNENYCIGYMESELPEYLIPLTESEALELIDNAEDGEGIYFGEKLENRWEEQPEEVEE